MNKFEVAAHCISGAFTCLVIYNSKPGFPGSKLFSWHPACMALAIFLWTEGIISFRKPKPERRFYAHWALAGTGLGLSVAGVIAVYKHKEIQNIPHFKSLHSRVGAATLCLLFAQATGGHVANLSGTLQQYIPAIKPAIVKYGHRVSGIACITGAYLAMFLSLKSFIIVPLTVPYFYAVTNARIN